MKMNYSWMMEQALKEAEKGRDSGEVPVGAVLVDAKGIITARAHNMPISLNDPTAHAEVMALRSAAASFKNYRLTGMTLVVTIEPCLMCMGAAINARISRVVFGAYDPKSGAAGSLYNLGEDNRLNHQIEVISGIMEEDCRNLIQDFFRYKRNGQKDHGEVPKWS